MLLICTDQIIIIFGVFISEPKQPRSEYPISSARIKITFGRVFIKYTIIIGVAQAKDSLRLIGVYVEAVMGIEQTAAFAQFIVNGFSTGDPGAALIECVADDPFVLAAD